MIGTAPTVRYEQPWVRRHYFDSVTRLDWPPQASRARLSVQERHIQFLSCKSIQNIPLDDFDARYALKQRTDEILQCATLLSGRTPILRSRDSTRHRFPSKECHQVASTPWTTLFRRRINSDSNVPRSNS